MSDEKLTPSILYTTEAEESKKKSDDDLSVEDPDEATAEKIIKENSSSKQKDTES